MSDNPVILSIMVGTILICTFDLHLQLDDLPFTISASQMHNIQQFNHLTIQPFDPF